VRERIEASFARAQGWEWAVVDAARTSRARRTRRQL
jgi:hypothetical protein